MSSKNRGFHGKFKTGRRDCIIKTDGQNSGYMKNSNRALILELLATERANTRIGLSKITGLSKMTVTNIIADFINSGLIVSGDEQVYGRVGRKPRTLSLAKNSPLLAGIYVSREEIHGLLCDIQLNVISRHSLTLTHETPETFSEKLTTICGKLISGTSRPVWGVGVASIGPVDSSTGILLNPRNFFGICDLDLRSLLSKHCGLPVFVENDMNAAALAELYYGAGQDYESFLYIGLTNGVGAGFVNDRRLYQPEYGLAGEIGHTGVDLCGDPCSCGRRGCVELYTSVPVLEKKLAACTGQHKTFAAYCGMNVPEITETLADAVSILSYALLNQVNMLNPQAVLLGHESAHLPPPLIQRLADTLNQGKLWGQHNKVHVHVSHYGSMSPVFGAVCTALSHWFSGELPEPLLYNDIHTGDKERKEWS